MINLDGVFGMFEMEVAARRIISKCQAAGTWSTPIVYEDFPDEREKNGFLCLIFYGWFRMLVEKGVFYVDGAFIKTIGDRVTGLTGDGSVECLFSVRYPLLSKYKTNVTEEEKR